MKLITNAIKRLPKRNLIEISNLLLCPEINADSIISSITTHTGLHLILSSLSENELKILKLVYSRKDYVTLGEIEKHLKVSIIETEDMTASLSGKLLLYTLKNRQLLSNRLDKIYTIKEISDVFNISELSDIKGKLKKISDSMLKTEKSFIRKLTASDNKIKSMLNPIIKSGGITSLTQLLKISPEDSINKTINTSIKNNLISAFHIMEYPFHTLVTVSEDLISELVSNENENKTEDINIANRYSFTINLLHTFDTISTHGLFLTRLKKFRIIDRKRITDAMIKITDIDGKIISQESVSQLTLFILKKLKCLKLQKDITKITLKNIQKKLEQPQKLLIKIINTLDLTEPTDDLFTSSLKIPDNNSVIIILKILWKVGNSAPDYLKTASLTEMRISLLDDNENLNVEMYPDENKLNETFLAALNFLCILGIIEIKKGLICLSDIGVETGTLAFKDKSKLVQREPVKSIYINPDFTIIIPENDIPSIALYHLLTHTKIVKDDVILHAVINRESVVKAQKRGMSLKGFEQALNSYSKNEIPQNMTFLLKEWANQTVKLEITDEILLKSSHPSFIDDILYSGIQAGITERISPTYAIIRKDFIDEIVKMAKKSDAIISLFETYEDDS